MSFDSRLKNWSISFMMAMISSSYETLSEVADLMAKMTRRKIETIVKKARNNGEEPILQGVNLSGADLTGVDLRSVFLNKANLSEARLIGANLSWANLDEANLSGADLFLVNFNGASFKAANLRKANLQKSYLNEVDLIATNLIEADLSEADLVAADLSEATNLSWAVMSYTGLCGLDLRDVQGLETITHKGPSYIDIHTLIQSQGWIPEIFLRGCGLSDAQIEMAKLHNPNLSPSQIIDITYKVADLLTDNPIQIDPCFISYASPDQALAERLYTDLQKNGVRCWYAPDKLKGGQKLKAQIDEAIRLHDVFLLILSEASMTSKWVKDEIAEAIGGKTLAKILGDEISKEGRLFPIRLVDFERIEDVWAGYGFGDEIREYYIPDFSQWQNPDVYQKSFERLLKDLRASSSI